MNITLRFSKTQCDWLANSFRYRDNRPPPVSWPIRRVYSQFEHDEQSCSFAFTRPSREFGGSSSWTLEDAADLRWALKRVLRIKCYSRPTRAVYVRSLRLLDDYLKTPIVDRLAALGQLL